MQVGKNNPAQHSGGAGRNIALDPGRQTKILLSFRQLDSEEIAAKPVKHLPGGEYARYTLPPQGFAQPTGFSKHPVALVRKDADGNPNTVEEFYVEIGKQANVTNQTPKPGKYGPFPILAAFPRD